MDKQTIINQLKTEKPFLQSEFGVEEIALFGSYVKGNENSNSDIDILVSLKNPTYSSLMGLYIYLETKFNSKVDLVRKGAHLSSRFLNYINKDLIYV